MDNKYANFSLLYIILSKGSPYHGSRENELWDEILSTTSPLLSDPWMFGIFSILFCRNHPILKQVRTIKIMTENYQVGSLYFEMSLQRVMTRNFGSYAPHYDMNIWIWCRTWKTTITIPCGNKKLVALM